MENTNKLSDTSKNFKVQLTEEQIEKFKEIYKAKFNIILDDKEAADY
jgi:hypothetical protein